MPAPRPLLDQIAVKFLVGDGCWPWIGATDQRGYGSLTRNYRRYKAHRVLYELFNGEIPAGMHVLHRCDNPNCVRPAHLSVGTHDDNMADMVSKGRAQRVNALKSHCRNGHPYDDKNTYYRPGGGRACRACHVIWSGDYVRRRGEGR